MLMKMMSKVNSLFFGESGEVSYKDVAIYTAFTTTMVIMVYVKIRIG